LEACDAMVVFSSGMILCVHATLKHLSLEPEPAALSTDPASFSMSARLIVGPTEGSGEESFDLTVCSPEWLAVRCREEGIVDGRHHLVVNAHDFDQRELWAWLDSRVRQAQGASWAEIAGKLGRLGYWEFEDYTD
jgi:hypothetical protein